uniref:G-protein coupled receptors family 1 profile domain-containing protein n=1 Tax=Loxodonta africana TaxID=9785 RepID=G3UDT2_LOXAF
WDPNNGSELPIASNRATNNISNMDYHYSSFYFVETTPFVTSIISLCGLVGNGIVIWLLGFCIKRNPFSVYILNLATADFTYLLCNTMWMLYFIFVDKYIYNLLLSALAFSFYMVSLSFLSAISTERCLSVLFPLWYKCHRPAHLSAVTCAITWALLLCLLLLVLLDICVLPGEVLHNLVLSLFCVLFFLVFTVVCVSSLILVIKVRCCSRRRQSSKLYLVIFFTVLAFLIFGLPWGITLMTSFLSLSLLYPSQVYYITNLLSAVNSSVNPIIHFFVGRMGQRQVQKPLREVLQSALIDDAE